MARPHVPDLDSIEALPNREIRFYAIVGAVVSLTAGLELAFLDIFIKGQQINRDAASAVLFQDKSTSLQRDMALAAMARRLANGPLLPNWTALEERIKRARGQSAPRHIVAHNVVSRIEVGGSGMLGFGPISGGPISSAPEEQFLVLEDQQKVLAVLQKPRLEDLESLLAFARELIALLTELDDFLRQLP